MTTDRSELNNCMRHLQKTRAVLVAVQFAANHDADFDVSDALAVVVALLDESLADLDRLEASP
jgi:hypothetical protein